MTGLEVIAPGAVSVYAGGVVLSARELVRRQWKTWGETPCPDGWESECHPRRTRGYHPVGRNGALGCALWWPVWVTGYYGARVAVATWDLVVTRIFGGPS